MSKTTTKAEETAVDDIELTRYELMTIIDPNASTADYKKHVEAIKKLLTDHGAAIWHEEDWGKRELAYSIKKHDYGYYLILNFDMDPSGMPKVEEQLRIINFVLRHLALKVPAGYEPQTYNLDEEEERPKKEEVAAKPAPVKKVASVKEEKPVPVEEVVVPEVEETVEDIAEEVVEEEVTPEVEAKPTTEESEANLSKLDAKLEELLSGDDDLNL